MRAKSPLGQIFMVSLRREIPVDIDAKDRKYP
jgi:hypothetical protein